jgi:hypothetical protein
MYIFFGGEGDDLMQYDQFVSLGKIIAIQIVSLRLPDFETFGA